MRRQGEHIFNEGDEVFSKENVTNFYTYNRYLISGTFMLYFLLLIVSNIMYLRQKFRYPFIWTGILFTAFTMASWWWLSDKVFAYKKAHEMWQGEFNVGLLIGFFISILGIALLAGNFAILKRITSSDKNKTAEEINITSKEDIQTDDQTKNSKE